MSGLETEGIFRVPGGGDEINYLKKEFEKGVQVTVFFSSKKRSERVCLPAFVSPFFQMCMQ